MTTEPTSTLKIITEPLTGIPWEDRPTDSREVIWRYSRNPIIPRDAVPCANSIFNSAVVPFQSKYAGVFRIDHRTKDQRLHSGFSDDAINWEIDPDPIQLTSDNPELHFQYGYDPRVCKIDGRYLVTWCNGYFGPTIGLAWTEDFRKYEQIENAFLPFNRNGVMFPRKIHGQYVMLSRPSDNGHTPFGDVFLSHSPDLIHWGKHRHVIDACGGWQGTKVGAGPVPIETSEGWLLIYHGVLTSCNGFIYSFGAALLDLDQPWKVIARGKPYLLAPQTLYECVGDVPNVAFPCAALVEPDSGKAAIYYGAADTVVALAFGYVQDIVDWVKANRM